MSLALNRCLASALIVLLTMALSGISASPSNATTHFIDCIGYDYAGNSSARIVSTDPFNACPSELVIPNEVAGREVNKIFASAFQYAAHVTSIYLPQNVNNIENRTFGGLPLLTRIDVDESNPFFSSSEGVLFNKDATLLIQFPRQFAQPSYVVPNSVEVIGESAFRAAELLQKVQFDSGSKLNKISNCAFCYAASLSETIFPSDSVLLVIGEGSFDSTSLTKFTFPRSVKEIGASAFAHVISADYIFEGNGNQLWIGTPSPFWSGVAHVSYSALGFDPWCLPDYAHCNTWMGLKVIRDFEDALVREARLSDLATRTISAKSKFPIKALAQQTGITIVSPKAKVSFKVDKSSKKICTKSGSRLKTLKAGTCIVTFSIQEPKPKKGKTPKPRKTVKSFIVQ